MLKTIYFRRTLTIVKYGFSISLILLSLNTTHNALYCIDGILLLAVIILFSDFLVSRNIIFGRLLNDCLVLLLNIQYVVLLFAGTFVTAIMVDNIASLEMLKGKASVYITFSAIILVMSFCPITSLFNKPILCEHILISALSGSLIFTIICGNMYSSFNALGNLACDIIKERKLAKTVDQIDVSPSAFLKRNTYQFYSKPEVLCDNPNVAVIFVEGLSEQIIEDDRAIMPNIKELQEIGLSFSNYFNHTAATYRGIIGDLFSGYQLRNLDGNKLISIQSLFKDVGYKTGFLNVEPYNASFTGYLEKLGFDEVVSNVTGENTGRILSDREAYREFFRYMENEHFSDTSFFLCMYTVGTHTSWDSPEEQFGSGTSNVLNRFYYSDVCFGEFFKQFRESNLFDDTILIVTTDHCAYSDSDYLEVFEDDDHEALVDEIPLIVYYKDIKGQTIDAGGRNSLCFAPTVCDLLDINGENYFLGTTLFAEVGEIANDLDVINCIDTNLRSTLNGMVRKLTEKQQLIVDERIRKYYALARE